MWENHKWRLIFIALPCRTPVPPPFLSSPAQPLVPLPPQSPYVVWFVLCNKSAARNSAKKDFPSKHNPTRSQSLLLLCFAGFYFASAPSSTHAETKGSPSLSQASPAATALPRQQPVLLLGSTTHSELHSFSVLQTAEWRKPYTTVQSLSMFFHCLIFSWWV